MVLKKAKWIIYVSAFFVVAYLILKNPAPYTLAANRLTCWSGLIVKLNILQTWLTTFASWRARPALGHIKTSMRMRVRLTL
jgi:hypothetical protein